MRKALRKKQQQQQQNMCSDCESAPLGFGPGPPWCEETELTTAAACRLTSSQGGAEKESSASCQAGWKAKMWQRKSMIILATSNWVINQRGIRLTQDFQEKDIRTLNWSNREEVCERLAWGYGNPMFSLKRIVAAGSNQCCISNFVKTHLLLKLIKVVIFFSSLFEAHTSRKRLQSVKQRASRAFYT